MLLPGVAETVDSQRPAHPVCLYFLFDQHLTPLSSISTSAILKFLTLQTLGMFSVGTHFGQHAVGSSTVSYPFGHFGQTGVVTSICVDTFLGKHGLLTSTQV